ncbi:hypothetical protein BZA77DRAFT_297109 [Pyronema omphalodes]|nr:hypothetical protein BZA77DRAFT_297109 [Pyronema omphalodes]
MNEEIRELLKEAITNEDDTVIESCCSEDTQYINKYLLSNNKNPPRLYREGIDTPEVCLRETLASKDQCSLPKDTGGVVLSREDLPSKDNPSNQQKLPGQPNSTNHSAMSQRLSNTTRHIIDRSHHYSPCKQRSRICNDWVMKKYSSNSPYFPRYAISPNRKHFSMLTKALMSQPCHTEEAVPRSTTQKYDIFKDEYCPPQVIESLKNEERYYIRHSCKKCLLVEKNKLKNYSKAVGRYSQIKRVNRLTLSHLGECTTDSTELPIQTDATNVSNTDINSPSSSTTASEANSPVWSRTSSDVASSRTATPPIVGETPPNKSTSSLWFPGKSKSTVSVAANPLETQPEESLRKKTASWLWFPGKSKSTVSLQNVTTLPQNNVKQTKKNVKSPALEITEQVSNKNRRVATASYDKVCQKFLFRGPITTKR